jgi:hypothetical protein
MVAYKRLWFVFALLAFVEKRVNFGAVVLVVTITALPDYIGRDIFFAMIAGKRQRLGGKPWHFAKQLPLECLSRL